MLTQFWPGAGRGPAPPADGGFAELPGPRGAAVPAGRGGGAARRGRRARAHGAGECYIQLHFIPTLRRTCYSAQSSPRTLAWCRICPECDGPSQAPRFWAGAGSRPLQWVFLGLGRWKYPGPAVCEAQRAKAGAIPHRKLLHGKPLGRSVHPHLTADHAIRKFQPLR
jgi:hypothetical protein